MEPRDYAERIERTRELPPGTEERFQGYGVMGLPFASGHVLAMRRFPASSVGPGYTSVWHRDPAGAWTFYSDAPPLQTCTRYFGSGVERAVECPIELAWPGPRTLQIGIESAALTWELELAPTFATHLLNGMARLMPGRMWKDPRVLSMMAAMAGPALGAGRLGMHGRAPNQQRFIANPLVVWAIPRASARIAATDLGPPGPLAQQARLGDFWIPQRGLFVIGRTFFEPFDAVRHLEVASRETAAAGR